MARMAVADLEAAVAVGPRHLQRPPEAYTRSSNRHEPVVPAAVPENHEMSSELRQRLQTESVPTASASDEESSETSPTLTPTSTEVRGEVAGKG
jgi:hypothetical protein